MEFLTFFVVVRSYRLSISFGSFIQKKLVAYSHMALIRYDIIKKNKNVESIWKKAILALMTFDVKIMIFITW